MFDVVGPLIILSAIVVYLNFLIWLDNLITEYIETGSDYIDYINTSVEKILEEVENNELVSNNN